MLGAQRRENHNRLGGRGARLSTCSQGRSRPERLPGKYEPERLHNREEATSPR